jgi:hypothetical protein
MQEQKTNMQNRAGEIVMRTKRVESIKVEAAASIQEHNTPESDHKFLSLTSTVGYFPT